MGKSAIHNPQSEIRNLQSMFDILQSKYQREYRIMINDLRFEKIARSAIRNLQSEIFNRCSTFFNQNIKENIE